MKIKWSGTVLIIILVGLAGCSDMHDQPSIMPQEGPRLSSPAEAVPISGKLVVGWSDELTNPVVVSEKSPLQGAELYRINCAMCHGTKKVYLGKVGKKLVPPPPSLHDPRIRNLSDSDIFKRISLGFGRMPSFQNELPPEARWHIVNYVQSF